MSFLSGVYPVYPIEPNSDCSRATNLVDGQRFGAEQRCSAYQSAFTAIENLQRVAENLQRVARSAIPTGQSTVISSPNSSSSWKSYSYGKVEAGPAQKSSNLASKASSAINQQKNVKYSTSSLNENLSAQDQIDSLLKSVNYKCMERSECFDL